MHIVTHKNKFSVELLIWPHRSHYLVLCRETPIINWLFKEPSRSRDSSVGVMMGCGLDGLGSIRGRDKILAFLLWLFQKMMQTVTLCAVLPS
jgi:hypothetical protein